MAKLNIIVPGMPAWEVELKPGVNRVGRAAGNDIQVNHPSVSSAHCEIVDSDGAPRVRDLGSTNGTALDGQRIEEGEMQPGQTLRIGEVEISRVSKPAIHVELPLPLPLRASGPPAAMPRPSPIMAARPKVNFYRSIPGVFVFPLRGNALALLAGGTVFFVVVGFLRGIMGAFGGIVGLIGAVAGVLFAGYVFNFVLSIINTAATGGEEPQGWGDFGSWTDLATGPILQMVVIFAVCFGPGFVYVGMAAKPIVWLAYAIWIAGLMYLPMALLAVAISDNVAAVNPLLVGVSILRIPAEYAVTLLVLGLLVILMWALDWLQGQWKAPVLASFTHEFVFLYGLMVLARLLGLLYCTRKGRLGWGLKGR